MVNVNSVTVCKWIWNKSCPKLQNLEYWLIIRQKMQMLFCAFNFLVSLLNPNWQMAEIMRLCPRVGYNGSRFYREEHLGSFSSEFYFPGAERSISRWQMAVSSNTEKSPSGSEHSNQSMRHLDDQPKMSSNACL